jgi:superoxide dismutase, Cu-Zn family
MRRYLTTAAGAVMLAACTAADDDAVRDSATADSPAAAIAPDPPVMVTVRDASGRELGVLALTDAASGILVTGGLTGLPPGDHGMHFHMIGRCDAPSFESAGEHWNPTTRQHGTENPLGPHLGDIPNVTVGTDSAATVQSVTPGGSLRSANMLIDTDGAALIIHTTRDDYRTDPSGASGKPLACGVIPNM